MSGIKRYLDSLRMEYGSDVFIGGLPYNLDDTNDQVKITKLFKSFPDLLPQEPVQKLTRVSDNGSVYEESAIEAEYLDKGYL